MDWKISSKPKVKALLSVSEMIRRCNIGKKFNMDGTNFHYVVMDLRLEYNAEDVLGVLCFTKHNPNNFKIMTAAAFNPETEPKFIEIESEIITATF